MPNITAPPPAVTAQPLDLALGDRDATVCPTCQRRLPAVDKPRFELETLDGDVLCLVCADKTHHSLRLAVALLNAALDDHAAGRNQAATEALIAVATGLQMINAENAGPAHKPNRARRRKQQRGNRRR